MAVPVFPPHEKARRTSGEVRPAGGPDIHWERYTPATPRSTVRGSYGRKRWPVW